MNKKEIDSSDRKKWYTDSCEALKQSNSIFWSSVSVDALVYNNNGDLWGDALSFFFLYLSLSLVCIFIEFVISSLDPR